MRVSEVLLRAYEFYEPRRMLRAGMYGKPSGLQPIFMCNILKESMLLPGQRYTSLSERTTMQQAIALIDATIKKLYCKTDTLFGAMIHHGLIPKTSGLWGEREYQLINTFWFLLIWTTTLKEKRDAKACKQVCHSA